MSTTARDRLQPFLITMLLGLVMSAGLWLLAEPEVAWIGFALAGAYRAAPHDRPCRPRLGRPIRG